MNQDDRLGPYRLLRRLGEGGMGVVHLGVDPQGRQVAVKVLRAEVAGDDVARRRLSREVETMRRVRNKHIAEVVDADVTGHRPYIVTRYVPGRPLDELVKEDGPLGEEALIRVGHGIADALAAVHAAGVIHRDLKPGNVMLLDGEPVLIDFGIAQAVDATRLTQTGMFIGTPGYLAPEIIEGQEAGPEVDVHAWAGTLIFAATGRPPFGKGTLEMIFFNITAGKANVDGAPERLRPILRAALSRDPSQRPTAAELVQRMAELLPGSARPAASEPQVPDDIMTLPNIYAPMADGGAATGSHTAPTAAQTARAEPTAQTGQAGQPAPLPSAGAQATGSPAPGPQPSGPQVPAQQPGHPVAPPTVPAPAVARAQQQDEFVSLLEQAPAEQGEGDPWPTVRVTGNQLRSAGLLRGEMPRPGQAAASTAPPGTPGTASPAEMPVTGTHLANVAKATPLPGASPAAAPGHGTGTGGGTGGTAPGTAAPAAGSPAASGTGSAPAWASPAPATKPATPKPATPAPAVPGDPSEGDIPTRRVRPGELAGLADVVRPRTAPPADPFAGLPTNNVYEQTPPRRLPGAMPSPPAAGPAAPAVAPHMPQAHQPPAHQPASHQPQAQPVQPQPHPQPSPAAAPAPARVAAPADARTYSWLGGLLLLALVALAVRAPVLVSLVMLPATVLLRAADMAQPRLNERRPATAAGGDVLRVLSMPGPLLKSLGYTIGLLLYGAILGLPVTLFLTVFVQRVSTPTALSWGLAVALWTVCAGPGVDGPRRQMRRTLASLFPARSTALTMAGLAGLVAAAATLLAVATFLARSQQVWWQPLDAGALVDVLDGLRQRAQTQ